MKKYYFAAIMVGLTLSNVSNVDATEIERASHDYIYETHPDEKWCTKPLASYVDFKGGILYRGCNTVAIDEVFSHYKKNTTADYQAAAMKNGSWEHGPRNQEQRYSIIELTLDGKNGTGIRLHD